MMPTYINNTLTIKDLFRKWIDSLGGSSHISNHDLDNCKKWISDTYNRTHNTSTIERAFRQMREKGQINAIDVTLSGSKEKRWLIST